MHASTDKPRPKIATVLASALKDFAVNIFAAHEFCQPCDPLDLMLAEQIKTSLQKLDLWRSA